MKVHFESSFEKDLRKIRDQKIRVKLKQAVELSVSENLKDGASIDRFLEWFPGVFFTYRDLTSRA